MNLWKQSYKLTPINLTDDTSNGLKTLSDSALTIKKSKPLSFNSITTYNFMIQGFNNALNAADIDFKSLSFEELFNVVKEFIQAEGVKNSVKAQRKSALKHSLLTSTSTLKDKATILNLFSEIKIGTKIPNIKSKVMSREEIKLLIENATIETAIFIKILFCVQNGYEAFISSICIERVKRAGEKIKEEISQKNALIEREGNLDIGYRVFSLKEKPTINENDDVQLTLVNKRATSMDTVINMMVTMSKESHLPIEIVEANLLYRVQDDYYVLGKCQTDLTKLESHAIYIDGYANIQLEDYLNLNSLKKENIKKAKQALSKRKKRFAANNARFCVLKFDIFI